MLNAYLRGAITHMITRARDLIEISQSDTVMELRPLQSKCSDELNQAIIFLGQALNKLDSSTKNTEAVARSYQAVAKQIHDIERLGVFAIRNTTVDDASLTRLVTAICKEIQYPGIAPTVSHTSQDYFEISPFFGLLRVPLVEGRYLLNLPDLYHELCHPLLAVIGGFNPKIDPLSTAFLNLKNERGVAMDAASLRGKRRRAGPDTTFRYALWRRCWIETWCEELLCDAFAAYCAGPAYGWTHHHLCFQRLQFHQNYSMFEVPQTRLNTHPADAARMSVILKVLKEIGAQDEAEAIKLAWTEFAASTGSEMSTNFELCYSDDALSGIAQVAVAAFRECGIVNFDNNAPQQISGKLQDAWHMFWSPNRSYEAWERPARDELIKNIP